MNTDKVLKIFQSTHSYKHDMVIQKKKLPKLKRQGKNILDFVKRKLSGFLFLFED